MKIKRFATISLALALTAGSAFTSMAAGFVSTSQGKKYQWGDGSYCTNNWVHYKNHWFYFGQRPAHENRLDSEGTTPGTTPLTPVSFRAAS